MAKLPRQLMRVFGTNAAINQRGVFGSLAAGSIAYSTDVEDIQALAEWTDGWFGAIVGANSPAIEDMNGMCYVFAYQLAYLMQAGIQEWNAETTYFIGSVTNDSYGNIYRSIADDNLNNAVTDTTKWLPLSYSSVDQLNTALATSVATNALTITLQNNSAGTPSQQNPAVISFRNATVTTGTFLRRMITSALSITIPSGTTIGTVNATEATIYVYALDNAGTVELAVSLSLFDEGSVQSTTAISGGSSEIALYSTTARTSKAIRLIGRIKVTEATAGTWATAPSEVSVAPFKSVMNPTIQRFTSGSGTYTKPAGVSYIRVKMVGGGAGGSGSGTANSTSGAGNNTTFGTSLLTASAGAASVNNSGGAGGSTTVNSPAIAVVSVSGGAGTAGQRLNVSTHINNGGSGGNSFFGGAGGGDSQFGGNPAAASNSGSGGGGGGTNGAAGVADTYSGGGGGAGGYVEAIIRNPSSTYAYSVGSGGSAGSGTMYSGGSGAAGIIIVEEYYN